MKKKHLSILALVCIIIHACQENPNVNTLENVKPINYNFNLSNGLEFNFQQKSESIKKVIPYSNSLAITNLGNIDINSINIGIYAFAKKDTFSFENISFVDNKTFTNIEMSKTSDTLSLFKNNHLFNDSNLIISVENLNNQNHSLSGSYKGEINIYDIIMSSDTTRVFSKSFLSIGTIDYRGRFYFLIEDSNETDISFLRGSFNSSNKVTGNIKNNANADFATLQTQVLNDSIAKRVNYKDISLTGSNFKGDLVFSTDNQQHLLEFNLTKQN